MSPSGARSVALEVVRRVTEEGAYSNLTLRALLDRTGLAQRDRAFAAELAYGTIRRLRQVDWVLERHVDRPLGSAPATARALLRLGAYQLLFVGTPPHAAVSETVALANARQRGFVNAVLRRVAAEPPTWPSGRSDEDVAVRHGIAEWLVRELRRSVGDEDLERAAAALATPAPLTVRANTCRISVEALEAAFARAGVGAIRGKLNPDSLIVRAGSPVELPGFGDGWFAVQDQASSFVVWALDPHPGDRVLDVCAGPGGKAAHAACLVGPTGLLAASDLSGSRVALVRDSASRLGVRVRLLVQDGRRPALAEGFDRILVDAPCSGVGSARRRPELLWRTERSELARLARLQVGIATASARLLRPGGRLVYSVCTFPRAETDAACDAIVRRAPFLEPIGIEGPEGTRERIRLWPHVDGTDAMFVAAFVRR